VIVKLRAKNHEVDARMEKQFSAGQSMLNQIVSLRIITMIYPRLGWRIKINLRPERLSKGGKNSLRYWVGILRRRNSNGGRVCAGK
jgi:hypothetical protein